jgi:conjugative relaxase-like TrwC/TraI family protein
MLGDLRALFSCAPVEHTPRNKLFSFENSLSPRIGYTSSVLSRKAQYSLANAKAYFEEHLSTGDYYSEGIAVAGQWFGEGAESLRLSGTVKRDEFLRLCDNLDPRTGNLLTQRLKTTRSVIGDDGEPRTVANRRVFYDFTYSPPKSVSIAAFIGNDSRIVDAHDRAVRVSLQELERLAATRVRAKNSMSDRHTGNLACAVFRHDTSRALDPHLHSHCVVFNATFDPVEHHWKALQSFEMVRARKYVENVYYHELARELRAFGYSMKHNARGDFEVQGVSSELCQRFSKRHQEIDEKTRELLAKKPHLAKGNVPEIRNSIAQTERSRKIKSVRLAELRSLWTSQVSPAEIEAVAALKRGVSHKPGDSTIESALAAVVWAEEHLFDRHPVVPEYELWRHTLEHARGQNITVEQVREAARSRGYIRDERLPHLVTSKAALEREWEVVRLAGDGIRRFRPLGDARSISNMRLTPEQRAAVEHILNSRDFITLFRGGAGTGKSYALREVGNGLQGAGHQIRVIAPQRQQVIGLEQDGFSRVQTVSEFLVRKPMPEGAIVMVDEAGQIGGKQMQQLLHCVSNCAGRLVLCGDTRQHGPVEASDALWAIEKYSGLKPAELNEIRRQDPELAKTAAERRQIEEYRQAVREASEGKLGASFDRLDHQSAIVTCSPFDQQDRLAESYLELASAGHSVVVVSQTWSEIHKVNDCVRATLKSRRLLGDEDRTVTALESVDLTDAQKRDRRFHADGAVLVFNQDTAGFHKGETGRLRDITSKGLVVEGERKIRTIRFQHLSRLTVCHPREVPLASGDRLQLKANGKTASGQQLVNGELVTVDRVLVDGRIKLRDGRVLGKDYRRFVRGFAITSYASQGKTVDYVLFSDSAVKAATNRQQWYVTISRGRRGVRIFTSDKAQLRENIVRADDRILAMDLANREFARRLGIPWQLVRHCPRPRLLAVAMSQQIRNFIASRRTQSIHESHSIGATPS